MTTSGIMLLAHGSRDPQWRQPIEAVAAQIRQRQPDAFVRCAYLELCDPQPAQAAIDLIADGARSIRIFPVFFGIGRHVRDDLPQLLEKMRAAHPGVQMELLASAGENPQLASLLADIVLSQDF